MPTNQNENNQALQNLIAMNKAKAEIKGYIKMQALIVSLKPKQYQMIWGITPNILCCLVMDCIRVHLPLLKRVRKQLVMVRFYGSNENDNDQQQQFCCVDRRNIIQWMADKQQDDGAT